MQYLHITTTSLTSFQTEKIPKLLQTNEIGQRHKISKHQVAQKKLAPTKLSINRIKMCQQSYRSFLLLNLSAKQAI